MAPNCPMTLAERIVPGRWAAIQSARISGLGSREGSSPVKRARAKPAGRVDKRQSQRQGARGIHVFGRRDGRGDGGGG